MTAPARLGPDGVLWGLAGDARFVPLLGRAFLLQVMHPTISAGVTEHSSFSRDPWGRLDHSWGLVLRTIYAPDGEAIGARVRAAHRGIRGVDANGRRYSAFEPEAYWWVAATGFDSLVYFARVIGRPLSAAARDRAYGEARELGRRLGLRDRDMPARLLDFDRWYAEMLESRIVQTPAALQVLRVMAALPVPPGVPPAAWAPLRPIARHTARLATVGALPEVARGRLGLRWNARDAAQLRALHRCLRAAGALPARWRYLPAARPAIP